MSPARRTRIASLALSLPLALWGCGASLQSIPSADVRAKLGTIGVVSGRFTPKGEFETYGRGGGSGAGRGALEGTLPGAAVGAYAGMFAAFACGPWAFLCVFSMVPGGAAIGAGFGGIVGAVSGAQAAVSEGKAQEVDTALERIRAGLKIQEGMRDAIVQLAREKASRRFLLLPGEGPAAPDKEADYRSLAGRGVDTILETSVRTIAMKDVILLEHGIREGSDGSSEGRQDPRLRFFMTVRTRLVRAADGKALYDQVAEYKGNIRKFSDWVSKDAELMRKELEGAYQALAGQIVTDLFLASP